MFETGIANSFNMTHMRAGQDDDCETSQFGIWLKAGAVSTGDNFDVYTKVNAKYWHVEIDFPEMCERTHFHSVFLKLVMKNTIQNILLEKVIQL